MKALSFFLLSLMLLGCQKATLELPEGTPRFTAEPYVNPRIIEDFVGWLSDSDNIITGVDLLNAQEDRRTRMDRERGPLPRLGRVLLYDRRDLGPRWRLYQQRQTGRSDLSG